MPGERRTARRRSGSEMSWSWAWIGAALVAGLCLGMTRMRLLSLAQQPSPERERGTYLCLRCLAAP
jgi:hypothetical protein